MTRPFVEIFTWNARSTRPYPTLSNFDPAAPRLARLCRRLLWSFAVGLVTRSVIFGFGAPTRRRRRSPVRLCRISSSRWRLWIAERPSGEDELRLVVSFAVTSVRMSPSSTLAKQLGDGERMNCENMLSSLRAPSADESFNDGDVYGRDPGFIGTSFATGLPCMLSTSKR